ncbi:uncharacterized protein BT62DRAFT_1013866 [Guyanagaster necrorhizus]|uniref:Nephrocystin 3-like N-terminal domain-containing protein n=1 Tax=Guyanagaster necrorhizus TaxID=856835 RepID=A0A9P8AKR9_9AGAR|nr:uncharacterized protein BT62DRAFT_1013866 [Guyanagaster necrorhizus MCA 3950]KAG7439488.1 hypothetical protein BT62DRAFT_1013866 [Guyanagaster necrorhizus MCA 3950]
MTTQQLACREHLMTGDLDADMGGEYVEGTRQDVLRVTLWLESNTHPLVCLLQGTAGTGQTPTANSIARITSNPDRHVLGSTSFCCRKEAHRKNIRCITPSIAFELATSVRHMDDNC